MPPSPPRPRRRPSVPRWATRRSAARRPGPAGSSTSAGATGDTAIRSCEEALALSPDPLNTAMALGWLGLAWLEQGELDAGDRAPRGSDAPARVQFGFRQAQAWFTAFLAEAHSRAQRLETALELASQGLELARAAGSTPGIGWATRALGHVAHARGALADAQEHLREALRAFEDAEAEFEIARTHLDLATLAHARGERTRAGRHLAEAHRRFRALDVPRWVERAEERAREWGVAPLKTRYTGGRARSRSSRSTPAGMEAEPRRAGRPLLRTPSRAARRSDSSPRCRRPRPERTGRRSRPRPARARGSSWRPTTPSSGSWDRPSSTSRCARTPATGPRCRR